MRLDEIKAAVIHHHGADNLAERFGLRLASTEPNGDGWVSCHAVTGEDRNPSAGFNVVTGAYIDHRGGDDDVRSIWDIAARTGFAGDYRGVLERLATEAGIDCSSRCDSVDLASSSGGAAVKTANTAPPKRPKLGQLNRINEPLTEERLAGLLESKRPISLEALEDAGAWPADWFGHEVVVFETVDSNGDVAGAMIVRADGQVFPEAGDLSERKAHTISGSKDGWIIPGGIELAKAADTIVRTEGWGDAMAAHSHLRDGEVVLTNALGCNCLGADFELFRGKHVVAIGDADTPGQRGLQKFAGKAASVAASVSVTQLPYEVSEDHGKDVRDFLNDGGDFRKLLDEAKPFEVESVDGEGGSSGEAQPGKMRIEVAPGREDLMLDEALRAIASDPDVFVSCSGLVRVGKVNSSDGNPGVVAIRPMKDDVVRSRLAARAEFYKVVDKSGELVEVTQSCPRTTVKALASEGFWNGIPRLDGLTKTPVMRPDGTVLSEPGYDQATRLFYSPNGPFPRIANKPTQEDAAKAAEVLKDLFRDFPFKDHDKGAAGCVAAIISLVGRPMIDGPVPMFLVDGNQAGCGKSLLADVIGAIALGERPPRETLPEGDEVAKVLTTLAVDGAPVVLFDNIDKPLGNGALDSVLTSTEWKGRILGMTKSVTSPWRAVMLGTGNNVTMRGDTYRRVLRVLLDSRVEHPEARSDFVHKDLLGHVRTNRTDLLAAALTMLRAWNVADRPEGDLGQWGSFEEFSRVVRGTLVFAGMADPAPAADRLELARTSDEKRSVIPALLDAWPTDDAGRPVVVTASQLVGIAQASPELNEVLEQLIPDGKKLTARTVGYMFRGICGQVVGTRRLVEQQGRSNTKLWTVKAV